MVETIKINHELPKIKKRFVGRSSNKSTSTNNNNNTTISVQTEIDPLLLSTINYLLPSNYNFELPKTISQIKKNQSTKVALQMPEGLLMYACSIVDIIEKFTKVECVIMGDVTYGACCIDDFTARALGCDMMVHYGHSCLVPVDTTTIKTLYVFVEIAVDRAHLAASIRLNFPHCIPTPSSSTSSSNYIKGKGPELEIKIEEEETNSLNSNCCNGSNNGCKTESTIVKKPTKLAVVGTIQFVAAVQGLKLDLETLLPEEELPVEKLLIGDSSTSTTTTTLIPLQPKEKIIFEICVPQVKPLSPGEILGCTAPRLSNDTEALIYIGDGRFHLESIMIANPLIPAFRYDPYTKKLTRELYEHDEMRKIRGIAVNQAKESLRINEKLSLLDKEGGGESTGEKGELWAVILGTLGRQGNLRVLRSITKHLSPSPSSLTISPLTSPLLASSHSTSFIPLLLSELSPAKLSLLTGISTFIQTSCPRLSIDWGYAFEKPLLSTYEASLALGVKGVRGWGGTGLGVPSVFVGLNKEVEEGEGEGDGKEYPMDFYADGSMGEWTPRHGMGIKKTGGEKGRPVPKSRK